MFFINPMWDNEAERIGKQKCTRLGYALHGISDGLGFLGLLLLFLTICFLIYRGIIGTFHPRILWLLAVPIVLDVIATVLFHISWLLAYRKGFEYNKSTREASWIENGERRTFKYPD